MIVSFSIPSVSPPLHQSLPPFHHKFHSLADWIYLLPLHHFLTLLPNIHDWHPYGLTRERGIDAEKQPFQSYGSIRRGGIENGRLHPLSQQLSVSLHQSPPPPLHSISLLLHSITNFSSSRQLDRFAPTPSPSYSSTKYA